MKKLTALFVVIFAVAFSSNIFAQNTSTASADASATIILPISIEKSQDLNFGTIASTTQAGWVTLNASTGNVTSQHTDQLTTLTTPTYAIFTVNGEDGALYSVTLPANGDVSLEGAGDDMPVINFTTNLSGNLNSLTLTGGEQEFNVGATLNVNANQAAGVYNGTFDVTVDYN